MQSTEIRQLLHLRQARARTGRAVVPLVARYGLEGGVASDQGAGKGAHISDVTGEGDDHPIHVFQADSGFLRAFEERFNVLRLRKESNYRVALMMASAIRPCIAAAARNALCRTKRHSRRRDADIQSEETFIILVKLFLDLLPLCVRISCGFDALNQRRFEFE
ncbi:MAG: hypothetical protein RO009_06985 [Pseudorhodoplanes sp.]|nr:hypothetical protein [Pseudorhodoplanes sp.]